MKYLFLIIASIILVSMISCDTQSDFFEGSNDSPKLLLAELNDTVYTESLSDSVRYGSKYYIKYKIDDEEKLKLSFDLGLDSVKIKGDTIIIDPKKDGSRTYKYTVKDSYNAFDEATLNLFVFKNIAPVAILSVKKIGTISNYEMEINALDSYDKDSNWGGKVVLYNYKVQTNYEITTEMPVINYIFQSSGTKTISVRVMDNDSCWSEFVTKTIVL